MRGDGKLHVRCSTRRRVLHMLGAVSPARGLGQLAARNVLRPHVHAIQAV